jgi:hypothetical protein
MCAVYRKFIARHILNNQFYSNKIIKNHRKLIVYPIDPIVNAFCKIADCHDAFKLMIELWNSIVEDGASNTEKKDESYWENNLIDFVNRVYTILYAEKFQYDENDPMRMTFGFAELKSARTLLVTSAIKIDKGPKNLK